MGHLGCTAYHSLNHFAGGGFLVDAVIAPIVLGLLLLAWACLGGFPSDGRSGMKFFTLASAGPILIIFGGGVFFLVSLQTSCHVKIF